jgi:hypothetical protein
MRSRRQTLDFELDVPLSLRTYQPSSPSTSSRRRLPQGVSSLYDKDRTRVVAGSRSGEADYGNGRGGNRSCWLDEAARLKLGRGAISVFDN